jgi:hypothetical protein
MTNPRVTATIANPVELVAAMATNRNISGIPTQTNKVSRHPESPTTFPVAESLSAVFMDGCSRGARDWKASPLLTGWDETC